jgi:hypothetical protein
MLFQFPNSGGISLHGAPVRVCHATALINKAVVFRHSPVLPFLSGQQVFYPFPRLVAYIVPVNAFFSFHAPFLPLSLYPVHTT